jgi:site-specific DNA-methyltransferase (adenine-specific)
MIELLNIDCMEYMATCKDKQFDLAIVDPPYGIGAGEMTMGSGRHKFKKGLKWDSSIPNELYFKELFRISKDQIIWGGNYFTDYLRPSKDWIIWDKCNPNLSFSEGEFAWQSSGTGVRIYKYYSALQDKIHPTQKPTELYKWTLHKYAQPDMKIIDTHLGSGSSAIAAYDFGCDFVGCEIDNEYYDSARKRFETHKMQKQIIFS